MRCLPGVPDKQATALVISKSLRERTSYLERVVDTATVDRSKHMQERVNNGAQWAYELILELSAAAEAQTTVLRGGMSGRSSGAEASPAGAGASVDRVRKAEVAAGRSKLEIRFHWEQGQDLTVGSGGFHRYTGGPKRVNDRLGP